MELLNIKMYVETLGHVNIYMAMAFLTFVALFLGGIIGFDRERKLKSAGIKTNILICIGSTLYTAVSILIQKTSGGAQMADVSRIAAQVVSGIGFLGAGAIIQSRGSVKGLTTAATIWVVAAIGVTIGAGFPIIAALFTFTILGVLKMLNPIYSWMEKDSEHKHYHIEILTKGNAKKQVKDVILAEINSINEMSEEFLDKEEDVRIINVFITAHPRRIGFIHKEIKEILKVEKANYHITEYTGKENGDD